MKDQQGCLADVHALLNELLPATGHTRILEAGGGSFSHIKINRKAHISVIDISPEQLARNDYAHDKILGDLEDPQAIRGQHDLIVCFDVLEHLERPERALRHMGAALAPGGLLVIGCPNRVSTKGTVTRFTPYGFHVWYYRNVRGIAEAGQPGHAPFETYLRPSMDYKAVQKQLKKLGLEIVLAQTYEGPAPNELKSSHPWLYRIYNLPSMLLVFFGKSPDLLRATDWIIVARRPAIDQKREWPMAQSA